MAGGMRTVTCGKGGGQRGQRWTAAFTFYQPMCFHLVRIFKGKGTLILYWGKKVKNFIVSEQCLRQAISGTNLKFRNVKQTVSDCPGLRKDT